MYAHSAFSAHSMKQRSHASHMCRLHVYNPISSSKLYCSYPSYKATRRWKNVENRNTI